MKFMHWAVWALDETLDAVPRREAGRWYRHGLWGCQFRLWRFWWREDATGGLLQRRVPDENGWVASPTLGRNEK